MTDNIAEAVRETCILATVRCRALGLKRTDREASREAARSADAIAGSASVTANRLAGADHLHKQITAVQNEAVATLRSMSMRYGDDDGWRLLPNANFIPFVSRLSAIKQKFDASLAELRQDAPAIIEQAKVNLGKLRVPIPTVDELVSAYEMATEFRELSEGRFRGLPPQVAEKLARKAQKDMERAVEKAQNDVLSRFVGPLEYFVERMRLFEEREAALAAGKSVGRVGVFRDSVTDNIKELAEVVGSLNPAGDPRIAQLTQDIQALVIEPDELRDSQPKREEAVRTATNILTNLNEWLA